VIRPLTRITRRQAVAASAAVLLAGLPIAVPQASADNLKHRKHQAHRQVHHAQTALDDSSSALRAATARLQAAQQQLAAAQRHLADTRGKLTAARILDAQMQAKLDAARHALEQAQQEVANSKADIVDKRNQIGRIALQSYQDGDPSLMGLKAVLTAQQPGDVMVQLNTVRNLVNRETDALDQLRAAKALLLVHRNQVAKAKDEVAARRAAAAANLVKRQALEQQAEQQRTEVAQLVASNRLARQQARQARLLDLAQLHAAERREEKIKRLILARARRAHGGYRGGIGGFLYRPLPGYITSPFGWRIHPIYHYWGLHDGVDMASPCGTPERAAGTGQVIAEYYSSVWGNRLYLDLGQVNGQDMTVIYNHIARYRVRTGAHVRRGETVAYEGTTGWSTGCHLHFTVMLDGKPVNPAQYF
jgi:murein DD-endopeptidase MepM/ murein hydrolase activator NlpD